MAWFWIVVLILAGVGYLAYKKGYGKEWLDRILSKESGTQIEILERKASKLEAEAVQAEKLRDLKRRITAASNRIANARR